MFSAAHFSILMTSLSIVFDIILSCMDNCGAVLTLIPSVSLTTALIMNTTIIDTSSNFHTIVVMCETFTLLAIGCGGSEERAQCYKPALCFLLFCLLLWNLFFDITPTVVVTVLKVINTVTSKCNKLETLCN